MSDTKPGPDFNPQPDPPGDRADTEQAAPSSPEPYPPGPTERGDDPEGSTEA